jgi:GldM C-terminal domain
MYLHFIKPLLIVWFLFMACHAVAQNNTGTDSADNKIFSKVETEAGYPGGNEAWRIFLTRNLDTDVAAKNGAPASHYRVMAKFVVSKTGDLTNISFETKTGYGTEEEVKRVLAKSGKWQPAFQNGRPVNAYRRQPITFAVIDDNFDIDTKVPFTFFTGQENELSITARKVKPEDLEVTISKGSIKQTSNGKYIVNVTQPGRVLITLYHTKKQKEIGVASFEVTTGK